MYVWRDGPKIIIGLLVTDISCAYDLLNLSGQLLIRGQPESLNPELEGLSHKQFLEFGRQVVCPSRGIYNQGLGIRAS